MEISEVRAELARIAGLASQVKALEIEKAADRERIEELEARAKTYGASSGGRAVSRETKALDTYLRSGREDELRALYTKDMSMGSAAAGGALVPELIQNEIITKAVARSRLASIVRRTQTSSSDFVRLVNLRGQAASWSSESGSRSTTNSLQLREIRPTHGELFSVVAVTNWLLQDAKFNVSALISEQATDQFSKSLEASILTGDGSSKPTGILNTAPTSASDDGSPQRAQDVIRFVDDSADHANDLYTVFFDLKPEYRPRATFVMSSATLSVIRKLRDTNGSGFLWQQSLANAVDAPDGLLLGKSVVTTESLGLIDASPEGFTLLCGDFQQGYELIEIGPMSIIRDDVTAKGKTLFYIYQRFGGRITDNDAIRALKA